MEVWEREGKGKENTMEVRKQREGKEGKGNEDDGSMEKEREMDLRKRKGKGKDFMKERKRD